MKKLLLILLCLPIIGFGQNVNIPDANFKAYLVGNGNINTNGDTEIQLSEANSYSDSICIYGGSSGGITNLTGIEFFTSLTKLILTTHGITHIDLNQDV